MALIKNSLWNTVGSIIPALVALPIMGILARTLGAESFGILMLAMTILGYASIFDAGLARAVIRSIAMLRDNLVQQHLVLGTALRVVTVLGFLGMFLLIVIAPWLVGVLHVSPAMQAETIVAIRILACAAPLFLITQVWQGYLEGQEYFAILNIYSMVTRILLACAPLCALWFYPSIVGCITALVLARAITLLAIIVVCYWQIPHLRQGKLSFSKQTLQDLFNFGGWLTVSNLVSPIMTHFDQLLVANVLGAKRVAFYTSPADLIERLLLIPSAVSRTTFPQLSLLIGQLKAGVIEHVQLQGYVKHGQNILLSSTISIALIVGVFAPQIMTQWLGVAFAGEPATVLRILLLGMVINASAYIPYSLIQAYGRADITAKLHAAEVLPYLALLYFGLHHFGIIGAAWAWVIRVTVDAIVLHGFAKRCLYQK